MRSRCFVVVTALVALVLSPAADAQPGLTGATGVRCSFTRQAVGTWTGSVATATPRPSTLTLRFDTIDADAGTAMLKNGAMASEVTVRAVEGYLHFMQAFRTGPLYTTTVFAAGASGGRFKAVHSRHEYFATPLPGATSSPEQYYGECDVSR